MNTHQGFWQKDAFGQSVGIEMLETAPGYAKAQLTITAEHLNGLETVHGGVIFTLADCVFAAASNSHGVPAMAINVTISYVKAMREGTLIAEAQETSLNPKLGTYTVRVTNEHEELIALFQGMVYRKTRSASR
ncbi:hotdog fold thioesterase [candidate division KSB3 bacterium]|uniref:Hotdog fold thioesterase n=1 Tax=candidate division KSB3 bacterium TaxID=2044937 RepID=A0A9D5K066_9BACT|nr:hotdog fold thioesterase [candidate division KSB3 bacterium]MBD3327348.1 hotdog fold thioesterase [candidate division KSB3 bacterium]